MFFRYLEEDPSVTVLERRRRLSGYELYLVEQWACSREHPTFVITTYTGLSQHSVLVGVLSVPTDESAWSPRLRVYFKAILQFHAREKETPLGTLMVTNLSGFPSALTVIAVPEGDIKKHREDFFVNENMKRMGCSGRAGLNLSPPTGPTLAKFNQLYHTSDRIPIYSAVIELVKLCQVALMLFQKLPPEYADGLLCDVTERAVNDWWTEVGTEFFNVEPNDGILGPTTIAALLGMLMGARNRLNAYGAPVGKDVFDLESTKRGLAYFQKSQKLQGTRRLDRQTLDRLHRVTAKAASGEGWTVPRAVKSTVAELSGKGGEMVMGMVGAREKAGIAEVETLDIENFIQLASGERAKWLWHGKPRKNTEGDIFGNLGGDDGMVFSGDDHGGYIWSGKKRDSVTHEPHARHGLSENLYMQPAQGSQMSIDSTDKDQILRRTVFKSVTGRMNDARSGLGRIKVGIPGLRGHHHKYSKDGYVASDGESIRAKHGQAGVMSLPALVPQSIPALGNARNGPSGGSLHSRQERSLPEGEPKPEEMFDAHASQKLLNDVDAESLSSLENTTRRQSEDNEANQLPSSNGYVDNLETSSHFEIMLEPHEKPHTTPNDREIGKDLERFRDGKTSPPLLRSTRSLSWIPNQATKGSRAYRWPRQLSFSTVADVLTTRENGDWTDLDDAPVGINPDRVLVLEESLAFQSRLMFARLQRLKLDDGSWVENRLSDIEGLDIQAGRNREELDTMYHQKCEDYHFIRGALDNRLAEERSSLADAIKDIEVLGAKLEYELSALQSKVEDVEDGVGEFERQVTEIETRAAELKHEKAVKDAWLWWLIKVVTGANMPVD